MNTIRYPKRRPTHPGALSAEMAARLAKLLQVSAESWLRMQSALDLWQVQQRAATFAGIKPLAKRRLAQVA